MSTDSQRGRHEHTADQHPYRLPYHWGMSRFHQYVVEQMVGRVAPLLRDRSVLEVGCGDGLTTALIARHARRVHAIDISERAIAFARMIVEEPNVEFDAGRAGDVLSHAGSLHGVDVVVAFEVFEHLSDVERDKFLRGSREVLAGREGWLILSTPNGARRVGRYLNPHHVREFDAGGLRSALRDAEFADVRITGVYLQPPWERLEHFANTVPFRAIFRRLARAGRTRPSRCRTLLCTARAT